MPVDISRLPYIDEHSIDLGLGADDAWPYLVDGIERSFGHGAARLYARLLRCDDVDATGPRPFAVGSTVPGFHVESIDPRASLVIVGHHRFSDYALSFRLERLDPYRTRLHAETRADFPGPMARIYRLLVIGSGGHVVAVRRLLSGVKRRADHSTVAPR